MLDLIDGVSSQGNINLLLGMAKMYMNYKEKHSFDITVELI